MTYEVEFCSGYKFEYLYPLVLHNLKYAKNITEQKTSLKWLDWNLIWYLQNTNNQLSNDRVDPDDLDKNGKNGKIERRKLSAIEIRTIISAIEDTMQEKFIDYFKHKLIKYFNWGIGKKLLIEEKVLIPIHGKTKPIEIIDYFSNLYQFTTIPIDMISIIINPYLIDDVELLCTRMKPNYGNSIGEFYDFRYHNQTLHKEKNCICFCKCKNCWHTYCDEEYDLNVTDLLFSSI